MNISMAPELEQFVNRRVSSGDYSCASEVIRAGLLLLQQHATEHSGPLEALGRDVREGLAQLRRGESKPGSEAFAQLRAKRKPAKRT